MDHGAGVLLTIARKAGIEFDRLSLRQMSGWGELRMAFKEIGAAQLCMNARSYNWPMAKQAARIFKDVNPAGKVLIGGMHSTVAPEEIESCEDIDHIVSGAGELVFLDLIADPAAFPRKVAGRSARGLDDWPRIDRTLWPRPDPRQGGQEWPLENPCGWGPGPSASIITSRVCPYQCNFCSENAYIANMGRRSVDSVIDELNDLDTRFGPIGSVVFHDSLFMQQPKWLEEFAEKYPSKAHKPWPFWAASRADLVRRWPELFEALVREANWNTISIGFESGSDRVLRILNKECSEADNDYTIQLVNRIGDEMAAEGKTPPKFFANIMFGIPGETREDAFKTVRMLKSMRRVLPSFAFFAPYPGAALGYQIIAEGKSLMGGDYHRFANEAKMTGIDYGFYNSLLAGAYDHIIDNGAPMSVLTRSQGTNGIEQGGRDKTRMFDHRPLAEARQ